MLGFFLFGRSLWVPISQKITGKKTVADVMELYGEGARDTVIPHFKKANVDYPPENLTFLAIKKEQLLEVWTTNSSGKSIHIHTYRIKKLSGNAGPKLREGDQQVPEGTYKIIGLNPNSSYHLSMKLNYPNTFDLQQAKKEGRTQPGTNIFIHGKSVSIGCLAMGDKTIEELFVLVSDVGIKNVSVVISPHDPRKNELSYDDSSQAEWVDELYKGIQSTFDGFRKTSGEDKM